MKKARLGFIGCGGISGAHGPRLASNPEVEFAAFCDIRLERAEKIRARYAGENSTASVYSDYKEMLDNETLDGVLVLTPHCFHYEQTKYALEKGVNVLLEKPMCIGVAECKDVMSIADAKGLILLVSYQRHYGAEYLQAKRFIESGAIGDVQLLSGFLTQDWQRGCTGKWRTDPAISGGGQLNDSGSHLQDVMLWLAGSRAVEVSAAIENNGAPVDIFSSISATLENGAILNLVVSGGPTPWREELNIWGSKGSAFYRNDHFEFIDERGNHLDPGPLPEGSDPDTNFVRAILHGEPIWGTGYNGLIVQELTRAAYESAQTGKRVNIGR